MGRTNYHNLLSAAILAGLSACSSIVLPETSSSVLAGTYTRTQTTKAWETIELRRDGTFTYLYLARSIQNRCQTEGSWELIDGESRSVVTKVVSTQPADWKSYCEGLPEEETWTVRPKKLMRPSITDRKITDRKIEFRKVPKEQQSVILQ